MSRHSRVVKMVAIGLALLLIGIVAVVIADGGPAAHHKGASTTSTSVSPTSTGSLPSSTAPSLTPHVVCANNAVADSQALEQALVDAESDNGTVVIGAGTCALDRSFRISRPVTIDGAGPMSTLIVEHARVNIFRIIATHVVVENLNLNTATYNATAPIRKNPDPLALISNADDTTVTNLAAETGSGFGIRFVGPNPCYTDLRSGDVIHDIEVTTTGIGGFASVDVDCQNGASLSDITIHGGILALYQDKNVTLNGETFTPDSFAQRCAPPWYITGPSSNISISNVTSAGGPGKISPVPNQHALYGGSPSARAIEASNNFQIGSQTVTDSACAALAN
jgi:hypothetical protein